VVVLDGSPSPKILFVHAAAHLAVASSPLRPRWLGGAAEDEEEDGEKERRRAGAGEGRRSTEVVAGTQRAM
jgi:hypothetical protein